MRQLPYSGQDASISPMAASSFIFTIWPCLSRGILPLCPIKLLPEEGMQGWIQSNRGIKFELRSNYLFCMDKLQPRRSPLPLNKLQVWEQKKVPCSSRVFLFRSYASKDYIYRYKSLLAIQTLKSYRLSQSLTDLNFSAKQHPCSWPET